MPALSVLQPLALAALRSPLVAWVLGLVMGWAYTAALLPSVGDVVRLRAQIQATASAAAQASLAALDAQLRHERTLRTAADLAQAQLTDQLRHLRDSTEDRRHALQTVATTGRDCLRSDALRVLDGAPGLWVSTDRPPAWATGATAGAAAAHAPAAPDPGLHPAEGLTASDRQVGDWILTAGAQYHECRARLDALITYVEADNTP
ncbi:hypothetical protein [uncultured Sphaerotilus sp.]|uniref:hypothetical protein n=1 Tax=uncultured Sphaerotilus sp. TaxID=474984 RepID=UPI0030CA3FFD